MMIKKKPSTVQRRTARTKTTTFELNFDLQFFFNYNKKPTYYRPSPRPTNCLRRNVFLHVSASVTEKKMIELAEHNARYRYLPNKTTTVKIVIFACSCLFYCAFGLQSTWIQSTYKLTETCQTYSDELKETDTDPREE